MSIRHRIKALLGAGYPKVEIARMMGVSLRTVQRIVKEPVVQPGDDAAERRRRRIGRPSVVRDFREQVLGLLERRPAIKSIEILGQVRAEGYRGGKTTMYAFVAQLRAHLADTGEPRRDKATTATGAAENRAATKQRTESVST